MMTQSNTPLRQAYLKTEAAEMYLEALLTLHYGDEAHAAKNEYHHNDPDVEAAAALYRKACSDWHNQVEAARNTANLNHWVLDDLPTDLEEPAPQHTLSGR